MCVCVCVCVCVCECVCVCVCVCCVCTHVYMRAYIFAIECSSIEGAFMICLVYVYNTLKVIIIQI